MIGKLFISLFFTIAFIQPLSAEVQQLKIDTEKSAVRWLGKKVAGQHNGYVRIKDGTVQIEDGKVVDGEFVLDMSSITNKDLEGKWKAKLENHLKSDDFFNVTQFPDGKFEILEVQQVSEDEIKVTGKLSIKEIALPVSFPAVIIQEDGRYKASAKVTIDRTKWDIRYNSGKWYDPATLGDKLIYDDIEIELDLATLPVQVQAQG